MANTAKFGFPLLPRQQVNAHITHNRAVIEADIMANTIIIEDRDLSSPPSGFVEGDAFIVSGSGTGDWTGFSSGDVAYYNGSTWRNFAPFEGLLIWVQDENLLLLYNGTNWLRVLPLDSSGNLVLGTGDISGDNLTMTGVMKCTESVDDPWISEYYRALSVSASTMGFKKSHNNSVGSHTAVANDHFLGGTVYYGSDGTEFEVAAHILAYCDGTVAADQMPGRLEFSTTKAGENAATLALTIDSEQDVILENGDLFHGSNKVVGARQTGWTDQTATASRSDLGGSPTVGALASFCRALYDDLKTHGLIGN